MGIRNKRLTAGTTRGDDWGGPNDVPQMSCRAFAMHGHGERKKDHIPRQVGCRTCDMLSDERI